MPGTQPSLGARKRRGELVFQVFWTHRCVYMNMKTTDFAGFDVCIIVFLR